MAVEYKLAEARYSSGQCWFQSGIFSNVGLILEHMWLHHLQNYEGWLGIGPTMVQHLLDTLAQCFVGDLDWTSRYEYKILAMATLEMFLHAGILVLILHPNPSYLKTDYLQMNILN